MFAIAKNRADLVGISLLIEGIANTPPFILLGFLAAVVGPGRK
jgi:hypothetical protein